MVTEFKLFDVLYDLPLENFNRKWSSVGLFKVFILKQLKYNHPPKDISGQMRSIVRIKLATLPV